jgi:hypothetical protein
MMVLSYMALAIQLAALVYCFYLGKFAGKSTRILMGQLYRLLQWCSRRCCARQRRPHRHDDRGGRVDTD